MGKCAKQCSILMFFTSIILIIFALIILLTWGNIYQRILKNNLEIRNASTNFDMWKETPIPMYLKVHMFNWTNSDAVIKSKWEIKPILEECGPYVFSEHHIRVNLQWNTNGTLTYQQKRIWHFLPELSNGNLNDTITNINPIVAVVGHKVKQLPPLIRSLVNGALRGLEKSLVITKTVDDLVFKGYNDTILRIAHSFKLLTFDKFGWFYKRNESESYDGTFTMYTGQDDIDLIGIMDLWNGAAYTEDYNGYCAYVNGTSGELWPPIKNYKRLSVFSSDICSTIAIDYVEDEKIAGVDGRKYVGSNYTFDNGSVFPEQACFQGDQVVPSGVRDVSRCKYGAPAFISFPNFYLADPRFLQGVNGLLPNKTHEMYMILEPETGVVLEAKAQLQLNLYIESIRGMSMFDNIKPLYMPMIWFSQEATITSKYALQLKFLLILPNAGMYSGWGILGIGILVGIFWVGYLIFTQRKNNHEEIDRLIPEEEGIIRS